jgi:hypothetical protein
VRPYLKVISGRLIILMHKLLVHSYRVSNKQVGKVLGQGKVKV